ncbi:hypothetical protein EMCRGX_G001032 [Ephydatia muelleri]
MVKKKYKIALKRLIPIIRKNGHPPPNASRRGPNGYWFLVAAALSNTTKPCDNYVLAVYRCWNYHKGGIQSLDDQLMNQNDEERKVSILEVSSHSDVVHGDTAVMECASSNLDEEFLRTLHQSKKEASSKVESTVYQDDCIDEQLITFGVENPDECNHNCDDDHDGDEHNGENEDDDYSDEDHNYEDHKYLYQKDDNDENVHHEEGHIKCDHDEGTDDTHCYCVCQQPYDPLR